MTRRVFNRMLLDEILARDGATLVGEYEKINRETRITFRCKCGIDGNKVMRAIVEKAGALCEACGKKHMIDSLQATMITKYGVSNPMKHTVIKEKAVETMNLRTKEEQTEINNKRKVTNTKKYGGPSPTYSLEIKAKIVQTCTDRYGVASPLQNEDILKKLISTNMKKYGVKSTAQTKEVNKKAKDTCLKKYGVISTALIPEVKEKQKKTLLENYGVENPFQSVIIRGKQKETLLKNYGVENPLQSNIILDRIKKTNMKKYGVEYPAQSPEIMEKTQKNAKKFKDFKFPSGIIRKVQGYEPFALQELLKAGYTEDQIKTERKEVPRITYTVNEKNRYYFPDIFLPHENKIIEVKSTWTYKCKTDNIGLKKEASIMAGYLYEIWCYDSKGKRVDITTSSSEEPSFLTDASADIITHV